MATTMTELARALELSKGQVSKLAARGMPTHDVAAAEAWRTEHLHPAWAKRHGNGSDGAADKDQLISYSRLVMDEVYKLITEEERDLMEKHCAQCNRPTADPLGDNRQRRSNDNSQNKVIHKRVRAIKQHRNQLGKQ